MQAETQRTLNALNRDFYSRRADEFSATRDHPWPGWERVWEHLHARQGTRGRRSEHDPHGRKDPNDRKDRKDRSERQGRRDGQGPALHVLDIGCGNGRLALFACDHAPGRVAYCGVDACEGLLAVARRRLGATEELEADLRAVDLIADDLETALPAGPFDWIAIFGLLHHLPGFAQRRALIESLAARLDPAGGLLSLTAWRFGEHERFRQRVRSWEHFNASAAAPVDTNDLEPGDHLLRWGEDDGLGGGALRYCHAADDAELERLLAGLPLALVDRFLADGRNGDLNRYVVLERSSG